MNFEAHAAEVVGGVIPQVRFRASTGRMMVVWQGPVVKYRDVDDAEQQALDAAELRIFEVVVGLFASDQIARLSQTALEPAKTAEAPPAPSLRRTDTGQWQVTDGRGFDATYGDPTTAAKVIDWLSNEDDHRALDDVIHPPSRLVQDSPQA